MPVVMGHTLGRRAAEGSECLRKFQTIRCCPTLRHHQDVCSSIIMMMRYHTTAGLPSLLTQVIIHKNLWFSLLFRKKQVVLITL